MRFQKIFSVVISSLLMLTLFTGCGNSYDADVLTVREGHFDGYPNVPIGKAFDQFFVNGHWESFKSTTNQTIVEFTGDCNWNNIPAKLKMQFTVTGQRFEVNYFAIDNNPVTVVEGIASIEKILSEYRK